METDYGKEEEGFLDQFAISTLSVSVVYYLQFFEQDTRWNSKKSIANHLMLKSEFNFLSKKNYKQLGEFTTGNGLEAQKLAAMTGTVTVSSIGIQGEYYFKDLSKFMFPNSEIKWNPYLNIGLAYSFYTNTLESSFGSGDWRQDITILPEKYRDSGELDVGSGSTFSFILGAGTRYKLSKKFDLAANLNWQYFFSDTLDGLKSNDVSNKYNEWLLNFQVGIIYHLNFSK